MTTQDNEIIYNSVRFKNDEIAELDEKYNHKIVLAIPRVNVKELLLKFGNASERPIVEIIIGSIFLGGGVYIALPLISNLLGSATSENTTYISPQSTKLLGLSLLFFPIAFYFFYLAFRRKYYLLVKTEKGNRKIIFQGSVQLNSLSKFVENVSRTFGWEIIRDGSFKRSE